MTLKFTDLKRGDIIINKKERPPIKYHVFNIFAGSVTISRFDFNSRLIVLSKSDLINFEKVGS